eukprot:3366645-Pyramimonas_sp.AAC.1
MKTDVVVVDGNAKNRRLTCAAPLRHCVTCPRLARRALRVPGRGLRGGGARGARGGGHGFGRLVEIVESAVDPGIVNVYFHGLGEDRRAASAGRRGAKARWRRAAASEVRRQLDAAAPAWDALTP